MLELPIERSGEQAIRLIVARTPNSGKVSFTLDGRTLKFSGDKRVIHLQQPHRKLSRVLHSNRVDLEIGKHPLVLRYEGVSESVKDQQAMIGIDVVWLKKAN
jgi:hypothetical protein